MMEEPRRVLIVDDEETVRNVLRRILEEEGYHVTTATNGSDALYLLSEANTEVVLLDIKMQGISGLEVLEKITADSSDICVIMVTAVVDTKTAIKAMKIGAFDYITKPFERSEVLQKMRKAIEKWNCQLQEKHRRLTLSDNLIKQTQRTKEQFAELIASLSREHDLIYQFAARHVNGGDSLLSKLPKELQQPMSSVEEFRDALVRILRNS